MSPQLPVVFKPRNWNSFGIAITILQLTSAKLGQQCHGCSAWLQVGIESVSVLFFDQVNSDFDETNTIPLRIYGDGAESTGMFSFEFCSCVFLQLSLLVYSRSC